MRQRLLSSFAVCLISACSGPEGERDGSVDDDAPACTAESCDDGLFCNGLEQCLPSGACAPAATLPCAGGSGCDEDTDRCANDCDVGADADGDGEDAIACGGGDCDDDDARRYPGNVDVCDAADVDEDCDPATFGTRDTDGDGFIDASCCNGATCGDDCDDARADLSPGNTEACDDLDNDCDGNVDEGVALPLYPDADGDGYGAMGSTPTVGCLGPGLALNATDCNDTSPTVNPASTELCADLIDNDCDGMVDETGPRVFFRDADGDSYGDPGDTVMTASCTPPAGYTGNSRDCYDASPDIHPGATETCNRLDDDCSIPLSGGADPSEDFDRDMHAPLDATCTGGFPRDDCRDSLADTYLGAPELCDGRDNDCSSGGGAASAEDADGDLHSPLGAACSGGFARDDCNDSESTVYTGALELCDRIDSNCSTGGGVATDEDADDDGHAPIGASCSGGGLPRDDCNDLDAEVHPGAVELCNGLDDDCSSGGGRLISEDADGDRFVSPTAACTGGPFPATDCEDANASRYPGAGLTNTSAIAPTNGERTGSALAAAIGTLRARFRWTAVSLPAAGCGPIAYELNVDDSCSTPGFASCSMPSAEVFEPAITSTSYLAGIPAPASVPIGRRYYWRVRACDRGQCSAWTAIRYLDVGRTRSDFDGDGRGDLAMRAGTTNVEVRMGSATGLTATPARTLTFPTFSARVETLATADFDGDGFSDLAVATRNTANNAPRILVYRGSPTGLPATSSVTVDPEFPIVGRAVVISADGDVDADGFADLLIGQPTAGSSYAWLFNGTSTGVATSSARSYARLGGVEFGSSVSLGDVNGDGFADAFIGSINEDLVFVYHGSASGLPATETTTLSDGVIANLVYFGAMVRVVGDTDGDGYGDVAIVSPAAGTQGELEIHRGSPTGVVPSAASTLAAWDDVNWTGFVAAADVDRSGSVDLAIGDPEDKVGGDAVSRVDYHQAGSAVRRFGTSTSDHRGGWGTFIDVQGDGFPDLVTAEQSTGGGCTSCLLIAYGSVAIGLPLPADFPSTTLMAGPGYMASRDLPPSSGWGPWRMPALVPRRRRESWPETTSDA